MFCAGCGCVLGRFLTLAALADPAQVDDLGHAGSLPVLAR